MYAENVYAEKFALVLPLMYEIEKRCDRKNRRSFDAFCDELRYFIDIFPPYLDDTCSDTLHKVCGLFQNKGFMDELMFFESWLYKARHSNNDYMFTLDDILGDNGKYERECHDFYYRVIY